MKCDCEEWRSFLNFGTANCMFSSFKFFKLPIKSIQKIFSASLLKDLFEGTNEKPLTCGPKVYNMDLPHFFV